MGKHNFVVKDHSYVCSLCNKVQTLFEEWDQECSVTTFVRVEPDEPMDYEKMTDEEIKRALGHFIPQEDDR